MSGKPNCPITVISSIYKISFLRKVGYAPLSGCPSPPQERWCPAFVAGYVLSRVRCSEFMFQRDMTSGATFVPT